MDDTGEARIVTAIEGTPTVGEFVVKPMLSGSNMTILEVRIERGVRSQTHSHSHESLIYVISGTLETIVDGQRLVLRPGETCCHPENVEHSVEALDDAVFLEVKSPVPRLLDTLGI